MEFPGQLKFLVDNKNRAVPREVQALKEIQEKRRIKEAEIRRQLELERKKTEQNR